MIAEKTMADGLRCSLNEVHEQKFSLSKALFQMKTLRFPGAPKANG